MQNYPVWWETTLTIYNKYEDPQTNLITWYRYVIDGAFWKYVGDKVTINDVTLETNNTICRIRKDKHFLPRHEWIKKPNDLMENFFTLGRGDIIVKGEVDDIINEYQSGKRSSDIIAKYKELQGCMTIEEIAINVGSGRCNEHYFVKGV